MAVLIFSLPLGRLGTGIGGLDVTQDLWHRESLHFAKPQFTLYTQSGMPGNSEPQEDAEWFMDSVR